MHVGWVHFLREEEWTLLSPCHNPQTLRDTRKRLEKRRLEEEEKMIGPTGHPWAQVQRLRWPASI